MAISFSCTGCGAHYSVRDELAGRKSRCKKCNAILQIPGVDAPATPDAYAAQAPDAYAAQAPMPPPVPPPVQTGYSPAQAVFAPAAPIGYAPPTSGGAGTLKIAPGVGIKIAVALLLALLLSAIWTNYRVGSLVIEQFPDPLQGRIWAYLGFSSIASIVQHLLITAGIGWLCVKAASATTRTRLQQPSYVLVAGAMACPSIAAMIAVSLLLSGTASGSGVRLDQILPLLLILLALGIGLLLATALLQGLLHLNWTTTLISAGTMIPGTLIAFFIVGRFLMPPLTELLLSASGLDAQSVQQWAQDNPEQAGAWRAQMQARAPAAPKQQASRPAQPRPPKQTPVEPPRKTDPLLGKTREIDTDFAHFDAAARNGFREDVQPMLDALAARASSLKPADESELWKRLNERLDRARKQVADLPSRQIPDWVFQPPQAERADLVALPDAELGEPVNVFGIALRLPKAYRPALREYEQREASVYFVDSPSPHRNAVVVRLLKDFNPKQQQPFTYRDARLAPVARDQLLLSVQTDAARPGTVGVRDLVFFEVDPERGSRHVDRRFLLRTEQGWIELISEKNPFGKEQEIPPLANLLASASSAVKDAGDPFAPAQIARWLDDDPRRACELLISIGQDSVPVLRQYLESSADGRGRRDATRALETITGVKETPAGAPDRPGRPDEKPVTIAEALARLDAAGTPFARRDACRAIGEAEFDEAQRDVVAQRLEAVMLGKDAFWCAEAAANALVKWHRPQTVSVLMPLIADERLNPALQKPVIKAMAATGDRKAVAPVLRWIIKQPDAVVEAAISMGPIVEDEVIKLLSGRDAGARPHAARILMQVGTRKSLGALYRVSKDTRDPASAAAAQSAHDAIQKRLAEQPQ